MKKKVYRVLALALLLCLCPAFIQSLGSAAQAANGVGSLVETSELFTERDMVQTADLSEAVYLEVSDGENITITSEGVYVLSGTATLYIRSSANGVVSKDDLKVTGGSYVISAQSHALEGKDSIRIVGGSFDLNAGKDGLHADNDSDAEKGVISIADGSFTISAADDGIHANTFAQIDGGMGGARGGWGGMNRTNGMNGMGGRRG